MSKSVKPIPDGYHVITPHLIVDDASRAIDFYKSVFDATELFRMDGPGGKIGHAELRLGDSVIMLADQHPESDVYAPAHYKGSPISLMIYVTDVDAVVKRAVAAGAKITRPVKDQFYGDRSGIIEDPFGHKWSVATHVEDVSPEEMDRRMKAAHG